MKKPLILFLVVLTLLLFACQSNIPSPAPPLENPADTANPVPTTDTTGIEAPATAVTLPADLTAQLDPFLQSQVYSEGGFPKTAAPGLVLLVDTPNGRYLQAVGSANLDDGTPMQPDGRLEIGSNSKSFTIALLMQLQEEGALSLDDPLSKWLPEQAAALPNGNQITLRQLARHTAGVWDYADAVIGAGTTDPDKLTQAYSPAELVQYAVDNGEPYFAPGDAGMWRYSNTGYILLGMVLEVAAGEPLADLYQTRIFDPLGLESAVLIAGVPQNEIDARGYWWTKDGARLDTTNWNVSQGWAAGGLAMTAADLAQYGQALAAGELFQNPDSLAEMRTFDPDAAPAPYGLGLMDFGDGYFGHEGQTAGFQSLWFTNPDTGVTVVGLTNSAAYNAFSFLELLPLFSGEPGVLRSEEWQWEQFLTPDGKTTFDDTEAVRILFGVFGGPEGVILGSEACDFISGTHSIDGRGGISFALDTSANTCDADSPVTQLAQHLRDAVRYHFENGRLFIELPADAGTLVFKPPAPLSTSVPAESTPAVERDAEITAVPFDLGNAVLVQTGGISEEMREMPVRLEGLIAAPPTGDNLPIAIIMHGSHGSGCDSPDDYTEAWPCPDDESKHYKGFAYLLEALAAQGYIAVSINANPAFVMAYGEANGNMRLPILFDMYLEQIAAAANGADVNFGVDLAGRVNWNQLVILGHSNGGEAVNWIVDGRAGRTDAAQINAGQGPIAAAILLAPSNTTTGEMEMALPFAVILPACDRDIVGLDGQSYYEYARMKPERDALTASVYLVGANHNRFNAALQEDDRLGNASAVCDGALLSPAAHQDFLANYVPRFFNAALGAGTGDTAAIAVDPAQAAPSTLFGRDVLTSLALPTMQRLILPLAGEGARGAATAVFCPQGFLTPEDDIEACRRNQYNQPGLPEMLALSWEGTDGVYEAALPDGSHDLSGYETLHLRTAVDPLSELNEAEQPQSFSVQLVDGAEKTAVVSLTNEPALAFPAGELLLKDYAPMPLWDNHVILSSIRVPLAEFSGVDLSDIQSIALLFEANDSGAIFLTDLELLRAD